jgi:sugar (pentulose or hexulose) kinase
MDILTDTERIAIDRIYAHGGLFKTPVPSQSILAAALGTDITLMESAGEGGAWGIALLASYLVNNPKKQDLADWLESVVFAGNTGVEIAPTKEDVEGFNKYIEYYKKGLAIEQAAVDNKK